MSSTSATLASHEVETPFETELRATLLAEIARMDGKPLHEPTLVDLTGAESKSASDSAISPSPPAVTAPGPSMQGRKQDMVDLTSQNSQVVPRIGVSAPEAVVAAPRAIMAHPAPVVIDLTSEDDEPAEQQRAVITGHHPQRPVLTSRHPQRPVPIVLNPECPGLFDFDWLVSPPPHGPRPDQCPWTRRNAEDVWLYMFSCRMAYKLNGGHLSPAAWYWFVKAHIHLILLLHYTAVEMRRRQSQDVGEALSIIESLRRPPTELLACANAEAAIERASCFLQGMRGT